MTQLLCGSLGFSQALTRVEVSGEPRVLEPVSLGYEVFAFTIRSTSEDGTCCEPGAVFVALIMLLLYPPLVAQRCLAMLVVHPDGSASKCIEPAHAVSRFSKLFGLPAREEPFRKE